jgi:2-methylisocitrate lyase-like PEP mutase family enzyme
VNLRKRFRALLATRRYIIAPGAFDSLTARLVQSAGFDCVYLTGGGFARASGYPDLGLLTMTEIVQFISRTVDVTDIPVIADMDTGYGSALNVVRAVRQYEKAGVAAFHIEDQLAAKKCGHYASKELVTTGEMVGKVKAAVDTRTDADLVIIARTDARAVEGLQAAIDRVNAYLEAGADLGFVDAPESREELAAVASALTKPAVADIFAGGKTPTLPAGDLEAMGFRLGLYPNAVHRASIFAARQVLDVLKRDGDTDAFEERMISWRDRDHAVDLPRWSRLEAIYKEES